MDRLAMRRMIAMVIAGIGNSPVGMYEPPLVISKGATKPHNRLSQKARRKRAHWTR